MILVREMKVLRSFVIILLILLLCGCGEHQLERTKVVATTSLIGSIVRAIGAERVELAVIVPSGMCPGHFDVKPSDVIKLSGAELILYHGWERWIGKLISSSKARAVMMDVKGNWMAPDVHIKAAGKIADALCNVDPKGCKLFKGNLKRYKDEIKSALGEMEEKLSRLKGAKVICSKMQEGFLRWAGLKIVATYGRPEELTTREMVRLVKLAREKKVKLFVDNLQSGPKAGLRMAEEVKAKHVTLTNFPLGETRDSYIISLRENVEKLVEALGCGR